MALKVHRVMRHFESFFYGSVLMAQPVGAALSFTVFTSHFSVIRRRRCVCKKQKRSDELIFFFFSFFSMESDDLVEKLTNRVEASSKSAKRFRVPNNPFLFQFADASAAQHQQITIHLLKKKKKKKKKKKT